MKMWLLGGVGVMGAFAGAITYTYNRWGRNTAPVYFNFNTSKNIIYVHGMFYDKLHYTKNGHNLTEYHIRPKKVVDYIFLLHDKKHLYNIAKTQYDVRDTRNVLECSKYERELKKAEHELNQVYNK